jgi:hypothetical protein
MEAETKNNDEEIHQIQSDSWLVDITAGDYFLGLYDQKS